MSKKSKKSKEIEMLQQYLPIDARREAGRQIVRRFGPRAVAKVASKAAVKTVARTAASPWLLVSDGVELGAEQLCRQLDVTPATARKVGKGAGLATSVGIGAAIGGPLGAGVGAAAWGIGELIGCLF